MSKMIVVILTLVVLQGCATTRKHFIQENQLSQLKEGISTKEDVIQLLGRPVNVIMTSDGKGQLVYSSKSKYRTNPINFVPLVGLFTVPAEMIAESRLPNQQALFLLNDDSILEKVSVTETDGGFGQGGDSGFNPSVQAGIQAKHVAQQRTIQNQLSTGSGWH